MSTFAAAICQRQETLFLGKEKEWGNLHKIERHVQRCVFEVFWDTYMFLINIFFPGGL